MVSTSGSQLLPEAATKTLIHELLPVAYLVTPNIPEANLIMREAGKTAPEVKDLDGLKQLAASILDLGPEYVLLKGGHLPLTEQGKVAVNDSDKEIVTNVLVGRNGDVEVVEVPYQRSKNTHGTGCSLASAIACNLAKNSDVKKAVRSACRYVEAAIKTSPNLGKGSGPLNHFHSVQVLPFSSYVYRQQPPGRTIVRLDKATTYLISVSWILMLIITVATSSNICWREMMSSLRGMSTRITISA